MDHDWIEGLDELPHDVVLLPEGLDGDTGIYRDECITFAKELRADGVDAGYLHDADRRTWSGRKGEALLVPAIIALSANVATGAATIAVSRWLERTFPDSSVRLRVIHKRAGGGQREKDLFTATGSGPEVAELFQAFEEARGDDDG
ncbi:MAG: hypothetical protein OSA99_21360 [Acidimicrobiales bacterium]|nr:hypothetical protein [Acidimicrobiales bacterium]